MSGLSPTEEKFEEHIEKHLCSIGYISTDFHDYDRSLCLIRDQVIEFIKTTQPEKWERLLKFTMLIQKIKYLIESHPKYPNAESLMF